MLAFQFVLEIHSANTIFATDKSPAADRRGRKF